MAGKKPDFDIAVAVPYTDRSANYYDPTDEPYIGHVQADIFESGFGVHD
jgi:hypothetical protein